MVKTYLEQFNYDIVKFGLWLRTNGTNIQIAFGLICQYSMLGRKFVDENDFSSTLVREAQKIEMESMAQAAQANYTTPYNLKDSNSLNVSDSTSSPVVEQPKDVEEAWYERTIKWILGQ